MINFDFATVGDSPLADTGSQKAEVGPALVSYDADHSFGNPDSGNILIQGCNRVLIPFLAENGLHERVKLVYLDPPYNNQESYTHYNDKQKHGDWIDAISATLQQILTLLTDDGSVWISIDEREMHYLKVAADQIFGRSNFVTTIIWQQRNTRENRKLFSQNHEYILVYAKDKVAFKKARNLLPPTQVLMDRYKNPDHDPRGPWQSVTAHAQSGHGTSAQFYSVRSPNGKLHFPPNGRCWIYNEERMTSEIRAGNISFGKDGNGVPRVKKFIDPASTGLVPETIWTSSEVGTSSSAKKDILSQFPNSLPFDTPKPEALLERILHIATKPGDIVMDPFLGSGTTCVVAHRMGRRYIGLEQGEQVVEFCIQRLKSEFAKARPQAITGGFSFYRLN